MAATTTTVCSIKLLPNSILPSYLISAPSNPLFSIARTTTGPLQRRSLTVGVRAQDSDRQPSQQQLNLSVLRFTLGMCKFSYLFCYFFDFFVCLYVLIRSQFNCQETNQTKSIIFMFSQIKICRDTGVGWVVLATMDWSWIWIACGAQPFPLLWSNSSSDCKVYTPLLLKE